MRDRSASEVFEAINLLVQSRSTCRLEGVDFVIAEAKRNVASGRIQVRLEATIQSWMTCSVCGEYVCEESLLDHLLCLMKRTDQIVQRHIDLERSN